MTKKAVSALLVLCVLMMSFSVAAAGSTISATCTDGKTVRYNGSGYEANRSYVLRIATGSQLLYMVNVNSNSDGTISGSVIIDGLDAGNSYQIYTDHLTNGTLASRSFMIAAPCGGNVGGDEEEEDDEDDEEDDDSSASSSEKATLGGKEITLNEDGTVTVSASHLSGTTGLTALQIPYKNGGNTYIAYGANGIIPLSKYSGETMTAMISAPGTYGVRDNAKVFTDTAGHWASDYIAFVTARELFSGVGEGKFSPHSSMTRAMFVTVLSRLDGADLTVYSGPSRYSDIVDHAWYKGAVEWAAEHAIISVASDGQFNPNADITREQMAVMLARYVSYKGYELPQIAPENTFDDDSKISSWAKADIASIQRAGIITGKTGNLFDPSGTATRAEVSTVFARFIEALVA